MSANNFHLLRKNKAGKFVIQSCSADADEYPPVLEATEGPIVFDTLEDAIDDYYGEGQTSMNWLGYPKYYDEYGLTIAVPKEERWASKP